MLFGTSHRSRHGRGVRVGAGVILGALLLATAAVRVLSGFLYGIGPYDPVTLVSAVALLLAVALAAAAIPARRAARVDPITVIRS